MGTQWNGENYGFGNCILIVFEPLPSDKNIPPAKLLQNNRSNEVKSREKQYKYGNWTPIL